MSLILPVSCFASVGYLAVVAGQECVTLEVFEHFPRRTFRNRYEIHTPQGILALSIPVVKPNGSKTYTRDVLIADQGNWRSDHLRALQSNYRSSPYFDHYEQEITELLMEKSHGSLVEYSVLTNSWLLNQFGFSVQFAITDTFSNASTPLPSRTKPYQQVYFGNDTFNSNLSGLDLLFNLGPAGRRILC